MRAPTSDRSRQRLRTTATIVVTALVIAPAAALATHSFSDVDDGDFFHAAVDWMKDNGVTVGCNPPNNTRYCPDDYVTRGEMAVFLERLDSENVFLRPGEATEDAGGDSLDGGDAETLDGKDSTDFLGLNGKAADANRLDGNDSSAFLPSSGETIFQIRNWQPRASGRLFVDAFQQSLLVSKGSVSNEFVIAYPDLPKQLFGVTMAVKQFDLCYTTGSGAIITQVTPAIFAEDGDSSAATVDISAHDPADRTDGACRTYSLSSPVALTTDRYFNVIVGVNVGATGANVRLTKATVTLVPA